jgi:hypothetical protein
MQKGGVKGKNSKENIENFGPKELWVSLVGKSIDMQGKSRRWMNKHIPFLLMKSLVLHRIVSYSSI